MPRFISFSLFPLKVKRKKFMRKHLKNYFFLALGLGIIFFILSKVSLEELVEILKKSNPTFLLLGVILSMIQPVLAAMKWDLLLKNRDIKIPFHSLLSSQMIGIFVSSFFPSRYSGDIYRTYVVAKSSGKTYDSAASVLLQRLSGLFVLVLIGFFGSVFCLGILGNYHLTLSVMAICLIILLVIGIIFSQKAFDIFDKVLKMLRLDFLRKPAVKFHIAVMKYLGDKKLIFKICLLSFFFYIEAFLIVFTASLAIGTKVPFIYIVFVVPVIYLLEALPISINGLGIREGAFVFFFTKIGLQYEQAFAISIIVLFYRLVKSLAGGVLFLMRRVDIRRMKRTRVKSVLPVEDM